MSSAVARGCHRRCGAQQASSSGAMRLAGPRLSSTSGASVLLPSAPIQGLPPRRALLSLSCGASRRAEAAVTAVQAEQHHAAAPGGAAHWPHLVFTHVTVTMVLAYAVLVLFNKSKLVS